MTQGQGGGGGGGSGRSQQQLNQLDLTEEDNLYETQSQATGSQDAQQNDSLQNLNRLKDLARRQEDLNERLQELQTALTEAENQDEREALERELKRLRDEQRRMLEDMDGSTRLAQDQEPQMRNPWTNWTRYANKLNKQPKPSKMKKSQASRRSQGSRRARIHAGGLQTAEFESIFSSHADIASTGQRHW